MITVPQAIADIVDTSPYLKDALSRGIINYSGLARELRPELEKRLFKDLSDASVMMGLKRYSKSVIGKQLVNPAEFIGDLVIKTNLVVYIHLSHKAFSVPLVQRVDTARARGDYAVILNASRKTTVIADMTLLKHLEQITLPRHFIKKYEAVGGVLVKLTGKYTKTPGIAQFVLQLLAWRNINIIELVFADEHIVVIVEHADIDSTVEALRSAVVSVQAKNENTD